MRHETLDANDSVEALVETERLIPTAISTAHVGLISRSGCERIAQYFLAAATTSHRSSWAGNGECQPFLLVVVTD